MQRVSAAFFPLDERWAISDGVYSPERTKQMVWLASHMPYALAVEVFERIAHQTVPLSAIWEATQQHGQRLQAYQIHQDQQVAVERVQLPPVGQDHPERLGISLDGGKLNVRDEGWKEFKAGTIYDVVVRPELDPVTHETEDQAHGVNMAYRAVLGSVDDFAPALWGLAVERRVPQAADVAVTADGAEWIWNLTADYFPDSVQIVDWFHATEHLAHAAEALHPNDADAARRWQHERRQDLYVGAVHKITQPLEQAGQASWAHYFHTHARRMRYQTFKEQGYPIGSGTVESGIKRFKHRLTGPGMRWSRPGAERMLVLRAAVMSQTFDKLWDLAKN